MAQDSDQAGPSVGDWKKSACILCECNCGLEIQTDGRRFAKIRGDKAHPSSAGYTCEKPLRLDFYQNGRRLETPLRRTPDGGYEEIGWDVAVAEIAAKLLKVREEHGGDKIFFYGGGGQGAHSNGAYLKSLMSVLGARYYSNALGQEKSGEMWVDGKISGGHTKGDFEHSEVIVFVGKNPWQSHSFPRTRPTLKAIAADPGRSIIVIDPRRTETAELADFHLQVRPGSDAWCLAAMLGVLVQEDLVDRVFLDQHAVEVEPVLAALADIPVAGFAEECGVDEQLIRAATRRFAAAKTAATYEDLGVQQSPNSTLCSYLNKLLWVLTGNFGKPGAMYLHSSLAPIAGGGSNASSRKKPSPAKRAAQKLVVRSAALAAEAVARAVPFAARSRLARPLAARLSRLGLATVVPAFGPKAGIGPSGGGGARRTPVTGARIIAGLVPCNSIVEEIRTDHPDRFRAMWVDSSNPAHSLVDSAGFREAMRELDLSVVVDVAFTETARHADYVLPANSQFEKWDVSFFNVEFPRNAAQVRPPVLSPLPGTRPESQIYAEVIRATGLVDRALVERLKRAEQDDHDVFRMAFFATLAAKPALAALVPYLLYEALGPGMPDGAAHVAFLWGAAHLCAFANPDGVRRAGFAGTGLEPGEKLFAALLSRPSGVVFTDDRWEDVWRYVRRRDRRFTVHIPELLAELDGLRGQKAVFTSEEFPFTLSAGERRSFTANTIIRNPDWRRRDGDGALRMSPQDAERLGVASGSLVRVVAERGSAEAMVEVSDMMQAGHMSLPNGLGLDTVDEGGNAVRRGVALNELTSVGRRDAFAGTPWHKNVPIRIEKAEAGGPVGILSEI
ncbi:MAG: molybdopterin-dependent oxidoreductase [Segniliparus sp.]|uniref:molybdopterin-dependent oxidoreductase n=1 Tax=Segniliparus sp. TaxID=2804064 RepID=UPI003F3E90FC